MKHFLCIIILLLVFSISEYTFEKTEYPTITIYHQNEDNQTLEEINTLISQVRAKAQVYFGIDIPKRTLNIYKNQKEFQRQRHPIIMKFIKLDWYIGDNIQERALIVSPNTRNRGHSYQSIINAIPHEYIHTVVYSINNKCPLWVNEGIALYLSNKHNVSTKKYKIPSKDVFFSNNSLFFQKNNGYVYADKFIEFVEEKYGHDRVLKLVNSGNYQNVIGESIDQIHSEWVDYLYKKYP
jgi:hypothetical protein